MTNINKIPEGIETEECEDKNIKVGMEFIMQLRAEANRQKTRRSIAILENITADANNSVKSDPEMDIISEDFEITEE